MTQSFADMSRIRYPKALRERAIELYRDHGAVEVTRMLEAEGHQKIPSNTVRQFAHRAGVKSERVEILRPMLEAQAVSHEERRARLVEQMLTIAEAAAQQELTLIAESDLRSVVGARTRAIHDLQLLTGAATHRTEHLEPVRAAEEMLDELAARRTRNVA